MTPIIILIITFSALLIALIAAHTIDAVDKLREVVMSTNQETIAAVVAELDKARTEIVARISELQDQIAAGVPSDQLDLSALTAAAQALDDVVPDAPAEPAVDSPQ